LPKEKLPLNAKGIASSQPKVGRQGLPWEKRGAEHKPA
jgi:hypothetical protein